MRKRLPLFRPLILLGSALIVTVVCLLLFVRIDRVEIARGHLAGGTQALYAPWDGRVERVFISPGDSIRAGSPLIEMESDHLMADESKSMARIETFSERILTLRSEKDRLSKQLHPAEMIQAKRDLERTRLELNSAEVKHSMTKKLWDMGLTTRLELQDAELALDLAKVALTEAEAAVPIIETRHGAQLEQIEGEIRDLTGQIAEERAMLAEIKRMLTLDTLSAEVDGIVLGSGLFELAGQTVAVGEELLRISSGAAERFEGVINDNARAAVRPGLRVKIRLEGYPWLIHGTLTGRLDFVADFRTENGGFPVKVSFDASTAPGPIYDGMRGEARIVVEEKVSLGRLFIEKLIGNKEP